MNKTIFKISAFLGAIIVVGLIYTGVSQLGNASLGARSDAATNMIGGLTAYSTTTAAALPVKILSLDSNRRYVAISTNSTTPVYLYFTTDTWTLDGSGTPATSTITSLNGIPVTSGALYEINPDNLIYGNIWASSTVSGIQINVNYK